LTVNLLYSLSCLLRTSGWKYCLKTYVDGSSDFYLTVERNQNDFIQLNIRGVGCMKQQVKYGYARESRKDKKANMQLVALREAGISPENIFVDQPSEREKFKELMERIKPGEVLVIKNLCQLGYNYHEILNEWKSITNMLNANVQVLDIELLDTSVERKEQANGAFISELFMQVIFFVAQQERNYIKHRQAEGIAYAKSQGRHLGRPRIPKPENFNEVCDIWRGGIISAEEAMIQLGLKRSTFERFVKERKEELRKEVNK